MKSDQFPQTKALANEGKMKVQPVYLQYDALKHFFCKMASGERKEDYGASNAGIEGRQKIFANQKW